MKNEEVEKIKKAGQILKEVREYSKMIVKKGEMLLNIANKIDSKILELGGKPAFPVNLSMNEIAAHSTPAWNSEEVASGLLKVDIGVQVDGFVADSAYSIDLEGSDENEKLIKSVEKALEEVSKFVKKGVKLREIGKIIGDKIESFGVSPVVNLSGHEIKSYDLHAGITIPNIDNGNEGILDDGLFAIEPFATSGLGKVRDGRPSGIFQLQSEGNVRDNFAREVLMYIYEEYNRLPFCSRWIYKKFGTRGILALSQIKQAGLLHEYPQLVEVSGKNVAQAEHTFLILKDEKIITTI